MINWWFIGLFAVVTLVASTVLAYPLRRHKLLCLLTVPLIFILTSTGYFMWGGFPQWQKYLQQEDKKILAQKMLESVKSPDELISKLREKLDDSPKSAKGWYLLGRIYMSQNAHMQAASAFAKAHQLEPENEQFTVNYAYSMWQSNKRHFTSDVVSLFTEVVRANPQQPDALSMLAMNAFTNHAYQEAISYWQRLLPLTPAQSDESLAIRKAIAKAEEQLKQQN